MATTKAGRFLDIHVAGFTWVMEWEWMTWGDPEREDSDVVFSTLSPTSANGGTYFVHHDPETGGWFVYEMGGRGPEIWEREFDVDLFDSPETAMRYIKKQYDLEMEAQVKAEEELEKFFEEERARAKKREDTDASHY